MEKTILITIPEDDRVIVQRADVERSARRDILVYLMEHPELNISDERRIAYQKEYDDKFWAFEQAKADIEKKYVQPAANGKAINWSLDYATCEVTITINE